MRRYHIPSVVDVQMIHHSLTSPRSLQQQGLGEWLNQRYVEKEEALKSYYAGADPIVVMRALGGSTASDIFAKHNRFDIVSITFNSSSSRFVHSGVASS